MTTRPGMRRRAAAGADRMFYDLKHEHARFGRVLALIGRHADAWVEAPDRRTLQLLTEAVDYIVNFQNRHHHPREELMFERIARRSTEHGVALEALHREHDEAHRAGQRLLRRLRMVESDPGRRTRRASLARELQSFARGMRAHIRREDELMYSSAMKVLGAADWRDLSRRGRAPPDPLLVQPGRQAGPYPALAKYVAEGESEAIVSTRPSRPLEAVLSRGTQFADGVIGCLRLLSRQTREANRLGFAAYGAAFRPQLPSAWRSSLTRALDDQCQARARWIAEWKAQLGIGQG